MLGSRCGRGRGPFCPATVIDGLVPREYGDLMPYLSPSTGHPDGSGGSPWYRIDGDRVYRASGRTREAAGATPGSACPVVSFNGPAATRTVAAVGRTS